ncbi:MAG: DsbA family protein, partial [Lactobacillus iners]|nr:DsbA family protein [Lactobacillus iners]
KCKYSEELVLQLINNLDLSAKTFKEMRQSEYVNMSIDEDLKLINTFNIKVTPTIIIYNYAKDEAGYLFEGKLEINCLKKMFQKPQPQQNKKIALSLHVLKNIT